MNKNSYYNFSRGELLDLISTDKTRILDCGCANGLLGKSIKQRQECKVIGIELNRKAASQARTHLDYIYHTDLNIFKNTELKTDFDLIIFSDILEHLLAPNITLSELSKKLTPNGDILASIPNVSHPYIQKQLARGLFRYTSAGILDATHLRFFTKTSIFQMFAAAGLKIYNIRPYPSQNNPIQYHIQARPVKPPPSTLTTTIIIATLNCLDYTKACVQSILDTTNTAAKIIIIDNASTDGTVEWLRQQDNILHIENTTNLGFSTSYNIGLELVNTDYVVLSNNDVVYSPGWLHRLIDTASIHESFGIVGPVSNEISGPQKDEQANYSTGEELRAYAKKVLEDTVRVPQEYPRIVFFSVLIKSKLLHTVGFLDENFTLGNFEDDDYCLRAGNAGYKNIYDPSVFVHHFGSTTWKRNNLDFKKAMEHNRLIFYSKHKGIKGLAPTPTT